MQPNATATPVAFDRLIKTNKKQAVSCVGGLRKEKVGIIGLVCTVLIIIDAMYVNPQTLLICVKSYNNNEEHAASGVNRE